MREVLTQSGESMVCPSCETPMEAPAPGQRVACPFCLWKGRAWVFHPPPVELDQPVAALPDDAVCAHHPDKKATAVCAGTGDYICPLCAVTVQGETYSATYLSQRRVQTTKLAGRLERTLARPDRRIRWLVVLSIFPCYQIFFAPVFLIWAGFEHARLVRMRREHALYAKLVGPAGATASALVIMLVAAIWLLIAGLVIVSFGW